MELQQGSKPAQGQKGDLRVWVCGPDGLQGRCRKDDVSDGTKSDDQYLLLVKVHYDYLTLDALNSTRSSMDLLIGDSG